WVPSRESRAVQSWAQGTGAPRDGERPLDHQDAVVHGLTDSRSPPGFVCARALGVAQRPVDLVDQARLCFIRSGREGEVRVAAGLEQHAKLGVDTAPAPVAT